MRIAYVVYEFTSIPDSVWDNKEQADARVKELDTENCGEFASIIPYQFNQPDGMMADNDVAKALAEVENDKA